MVSGLAPGRLALTWMVGKSTCGSGATGKQRIGDEADEQDARHQQRGADRVADERRRNAFVHAQVRMTAGASFPESREPCALVACTDVRFQIPCSGGSARICESEAAVWPGAYSLPEWLRERKRSCHPFNLRPIGWSPARPRTGGTGPQICVLTVPLNTWSGQSDYERGHDHRPRRSSDRNLRAAGKTVGRQGVAEGDRADLADRAESAAAVRRHRRGLGGAAGRPAGADVGCRDASPIARSPSA